MSKTESHSGLRGDAENCIRNNRRELETAPEEGLWTVHVTDFHPGKLKNFHRYGIVEEVESISGRHIGNGNGSATWRLWRLTPKARAYLDTLSQDERAAMPCGHSGFTNDGEFLQCKECGGRFTKQEVKEYEP
jgi:hypothetical protein